MMACIDSEAGRVTSSVGERWRFCLALCFLLTHGTAIGGCDDDGGGSSSSGPEIVERTTAQGLRLAETEIRAHVDSDSVRVSLPLHRTTAGAIAGEADVELLRIEDGSVLSTDRSEFELAENRDDLTIETALAFTPPEDTDDSQGALAAYALRYRVAWSGDSLWGRRSLFSALPLTETQLLSPNTFQTGTASHLRVIARHPGTGEPSERLPVTVGIERGDPAAFETLFEGETDAFGNLSARIEPDDDMAGEGELVVKIDAPGHRQELRANVAIERASKVLLTTDKPLYQPGQLIHLRALALRRPNLEPEADRPLTFQIYDGKDNKVERVTLRTDEFGIAATRFRLAREVNMGTYRIEAILNGADEPAAQKTVTVDRYSLPKFDLDLELDREVYLAGSLLEGTVRARYFFGQAVEGGEVVVTAATLDVGRTLFAEVQGSTNDDGLYRFEIQLPPYVVGLPLEQGGGMVELALMVTDTAGQARTVTRTVRIAKGALEIVVVPESGELAAGLENVILVRSTDAAGRPTAASHRMQVNGQDIEPFETDEHGMAAVPIEVVGNTVALDVESTDADGFVVESHFDFTAGTGESAGAVLLRTGRALYRVGETLEVDVLTIGAHDRIYLDVIRAGQTVLTEMLEPDAAGHARYALDLANDHAGALQIDAYYLALGSSLRRDSKLVYVDPAGGLKIEIDADQPVYLPGEEAQLTFQVTDADGAGMATALGLQVVDEAVFGLMEFRPGLEKTYFQIEAELGQPRYQIGVPSLPTLASDPQAVESQERQDQAALLFAATDAAAAYPISINTFVEAQATVREVVTPLVRVIADEYIEALRKARAFGIVHDENLRQVIESDLFTMHDPWGRALQTVLEADDRTLTLRSLGPDERLDTADDVTLAYTRNDVLHDRSGGNRAIGEDEEGDWANDPMPGAAGGGDVPQAPNADFDADGDGVDDAAGEGHGGGNQRPRVRRNFPETLFVEPALITDGSGEATLTIPLADSITTWRLSALANSATGQLGSTDTGIRVFQDFFADIDFPATLTRGDEFGVPIAIYNYLDVPQRVRIEMVPGEWFTLLGEGARDVDLGPGEVAGLRMPVRVEQVGLHELTVYALGDELQDAVARTVLVEPDGRQVQSIDAGKLDGNVRQTVTLPVRAVEGSGKLLVKIYPGLFAQVLEGMDSILRMPSGCFEQTSSSTWPNALVEQYMNETDTGSPELHARANQYINTGYQRLLTFEVAGGGFDWFGNPPAHVVLTAYGLLEFTDMARVRTIDEAMIERTRSWLLGQQQADGHWAVAGRGLDETGQLSDPTTVTAYVAFALAAAGHGGAALDRARQYLEGRLGQMGTYSLALFANFMVAHQPDAPLTTQLLSALADRVEATVGGGGGGGGDNDQPAAAAHWETDEQTTTYGQGEGAWIETTALATHALLASGTHRPTAQAAVDWLVTKKQPNGAWGSTAGTVWSIKCLLQALSGGQDEEANAVVLVQLDGEERARFRVTADNSDVMRQADLSEHLVAGQPHVVEITLEGQGNLQYGVVQSFHEPWDDAPPPEGPLSIDVSYDRTHLVIDDMVTVTVNVSNRDLAYADMVMVDLGIPPGFDVVASDLEGLRDGGVFSRFETTERQLLLYFTVIRPDAPVRFDYRIIARDPIRAQAPRSRVYSYYNPGVGAETEPIDVEVE